VVNIVAKCSAEFAEGFAELRNVPQSLRKALQSCETSRRVCGRLCRVAKRPAEFAEGFAELRNVPQSLRKEWGCVKSPGRGENLLLTPYKQSAVRGACVDDMSLRDF